MAVIPAWAVFVSPKFARPSEKIRKNPKTVFRSARLGRGPGLCLHRDRFARRSVVGSVSGSMGKESRDDLDRDGKLGSAGRSLDLRLGWSSHDSLGTEIVPPGRVRPGPPALVGSGSGSMGKESRDDLDRDGKLGSAGRSLDLRLGWSSHDSLGIEIVPPGRVRPGPPALVGSGSSSMGKESRDDLDRDGNLGPARGVHWI
jgi:hypothetical protein